MTPLPRPLLALLLLLPLAVLAAERVDSVAITVGDLERALALGYQAHDLRHWHVTTMTQDIAALETGLRAAGAGLSRPVSSTCHRMPSDSAARCWR